MALLESIRPSWWLTRVKQRDDRDRGRLVMSTRTKTVVSGTCGGISLVAIGHPFDTVKVKLQTQCSLSGSPVFSGPLDCARRTVEQEGFRGLYAGIVSPLFAQMFKSACLFTAHDEVKMLIMARNGGQPLTFSENFVGGALGGAVVSVFESPTELFKSKMQVQSQMKSSATRYTSTLECVRQVTRTNGVRGWYQGYSSALLTYAAANGLFFALYGWMRARLDPHGERRALPLFLSGAAAGCTFTILCYPLDTIKSTLMADSTRAQDRQYRGVIDCAAKLYARHGLRSFTQGLGASLMRATPGLGMLVMTVESTKKFIEQLAPLPE